MTIGKTQLRADGLAVRMVSITLFGGIALGTLGGDQTRVAGIAARLLAYLVVTSGRANTREEIATALWPDDDPEATRARLRQALHALRAAIEEAGLSSLDILDTSRTRLRLIPDAVVSDIGDFERLCASARETGSSEERVAHLKAADALYRGVLAPEFDGEWIEPHRARLAAIQRTAILDLARALEETGDTSAAIEVARRAVAEEPLSEESRCALMRLYAASGQPGEVLRQFRELERVMEAELGEKPSASTRELANRLRAADVRSLAIEPSNGDRSSMVPYEEVLAPQALRSKSRTGSFAVIAVILVIVLSAGAWYANRARPAAPVSPGAVPEGRLLWHADLPASAGFLDSEPAAVISGYAGHSFVTGFGKTPQHDVDFLTAGLDPGGKFEWITPFNGAGNDMDRAVGLVLGPVSIAVVGETDSGKGNEATRLSSLDIVLKTYQLDGKGIGQDVWAGSCGGEDRPSQIAVNPGGISVCGYTWVGQFRKDDPRYAWVVLQYDQNGKRKWARTLFDEHNADARATSIVCPGDLIVAGFVSRRTESGVETTCEAVCLNAIDGREMWRRAIVSWSGACERFCHVCLAPDGIYVTGTLGWATRSGTVPGIFIARLDNNGNIRWLRRACRPTGRRELAEAIDSDQQGRVCVAGSAEAEPGSSEVFTVVFDADGNTLWEHRYRALPTGMNSPKAIRICDQAGGVAVAGFASTRPSMGEDYVGRDSMLLRFDGNGRLLWKSLYDGGDHGLDFATALAIDEHGNIIIAGQSQHNGAPQIFVRTYAP